MTGHDGLEDRLEAIEDTVRDPTEEYAPLVIYKNGDEYTMPDGEEIPTDDDGEPILSGIGTTIVLPKESRQPPEWVND